ncbi:ABC transporter ATP-binding protein/permease [Yinghuangia sp. ASG 101]|uniref:ABC transporter ATP-binding protein n=1 Tax=Yinghuangia sp. ASG 101 TaxID=2896848 RepID=UPI001E29D7ED|nr:ABC transporter ATP-binding protein [Yinghuangia sp. ASG 101]UGQ13994.1 ABC transporter ATP-binding protein/permease [Yinghuangia sp. ASG 101]
MAASGTGFRAAWRCAPGWTAALLVSVPAASAAALLLPAAAAAAVDTVLDGGGAGTALLPLAGVLVLGLIAALVGELAGPAVTAALTARLRGQLAEHTVALGTGSRNPFPAGDVTGRLVGSAPDAARFVPSVIGTLGALVTSLGGIVALGLLDPWLAAAFLGGVVPGLLVVRAFMVRATHLFERYQEVQGRISARLADALGGVRTIRACGTRDREEARVLRPLPELSAVGHELWRAQRRAVAQVLVLAPVVEIAVLAVAGWALAEGRIPPGGMVAAAGYAALGLGFLEQLESLVGVAHARAGARRAGELLAVPPAAHGRLRELPAGRGELTFHDVSVRAGDRVLLSHVRLTVPAGTSLALVGASGAGKSLLAALPGRLRDPDEGEVRVDGTPVTALARGESARAVAYGFPDPVLLGSDVRDALGFGRPDAGAGDGTAIGRAAATARADGFVLGLPDGYATPVAELALSGGEMQRLGLARAIAQGARVLVLDDATSGLDMVTEHQVMEAVRHRLHGRTRILVAHRAAAAAQADRVAWLDNGRVRAVGTHAELWQDPDYRAVFAGGHP